MKRKLLFILLTYLCVTTSFAQKFEGLALTPPMGWNSWNKFACNIDENLIKSVADAMVETGLRDAGYVYLNLDDSVRVTNTGQRDGIEIVQLYIRDKFNCVTRPVKELKDLARIALKAGESKIVNFKITPDKLAFYNIQMHKIVEPGEFIVMAGLSSDEKDLL